MPERPAPSAYRSAPGTSALVLSACCFSRGLVARIPLDYSGVLSIPPAKPPASLGARFFSILPPPSDFQRPSKPPHPRLQDALGLSPPRTVPGASRTHRSRRPRFPVLPPAFLLTVGTNGVPAPREAAQQQEAKNQTHPHRSPSPPSPPRRLLHGGSRASAPAREPPRPRPDPGGSFERPPAAARPTARLVTRPPAPALGILASESCF